MNYRLTPLRPDEAQAASPGKFRVVLGDFSPEQVGDEVYTIAEAISVCEAVAREHDVKIVDDQGNVTLPRREPPGSMQSWGLSGVCDSGFRISQR